MAALWCPGAQLVTSVKGPGAVKSTLNLWLLECWTQVQLFPSSQPEEKLPGRRATWCRPPAPRPAWQTQVFTLYLFWEMWKHQCCTCSSKTYRSSWYSLIPEFICTGLFALDIYKQSSYNIYIYFHKLSKQSPPLQLVYKPWLMRSPSNKNHRLLLQLLQVQHHDPAAGRRGELLHLLESTRSQHWTKHIIVIVFAIVVIVSLNLSSSF